MADQDELKKYNGPAFSGEEHGSPYPVSRLAPQMGLVDLARQLEQADKLINTRVNAKLQVIATQIKNLQDEARRVMEQANQDQVLHQAQCHFKRIPGNIYHLYENEQGLSYFSMLSPRDWGGSSPHDFRGSFRLENDMSWTPI